MRAASAALDDKQLVVWADGLDWSEPVVSIKRFGSSGRSMGYEQVEASVWSLAEILVMLGDERLVEVLLSKDRLPTPYNINGASVKKNSYLDVPIEIALVNAGIRTGSSAIVKRVLSVVADPDRPFINQWFSDGYYSPLTCLADQLQLAPEKSMAIWAEMEDHAFSAGESMGKGYGDNLVDSFRKRGLSECCRIGNAPLAHAISKRTKQPLTKSMWMELLDEGNISWCCDYLGTRKKWPARKDSEDHDTHGQDVAPVILLSQAIEQVAKVKETFKTHKDLTKHLAAARANVENVIEKLWSARAGQTLLSLEIVQWGREVGPLLVRYDLDNAIPRLNGLGVALSIQEAVEIAKVASEGVAREIIESRSSCGVVEMNSDAAANYLGDELTSSEGFKVPAVAQIMHHWGIRSLASWDLDPAFLAAVEASSMQHATPPTDPAARRPARRV